MKSHQLQNNKKTVTAQTAPCGELYEILHKLLDRRYYLMPFVQEFNYIDSTLTSYFKEIKILRIGDYEIRSRPKESFSLSLPSALKAKYLKKNKKQTVEIKKWK